jgi:hypothetical protein
MTEDDLLGAVLDMARLLGHHVAHFRPARTDRGWRTAVQADGKGYPDLTIVGHGGVMFRELKSATGRSGSEQQVWAAKLEYAGADFAVWRPCDLRSGRINAELRALRVRNPERQETR